MKHLLFLLLIFTTLACGSENKQASESTTNNIENVQNVYAFKTLGLNDSIVADSIWKMIFNIDGIEQLVIQNDDSLVVIRTSGENITEKQLKLEITARGGAIID